MIELKNESYQVSSYDVDYANRMIRKSGSKLSMKGPNAEDIAYEISVAKLMGITEKELLRILAFAIHPDDIAEAIYNSKGLTKRYADLYINDETLPLNSRRKRK